MNVSASTNNPFPIIGDKLFPDSYFGATEPVNHQLPMTADKEGVSYKDVIDTVNPLQHIPVISTIYREVTGDQPAAGSRLLGSVLYGGPIGLFGEVINCAIDDNTGKDVGGHVVAMFKDDSPSPSAEPSAKPATQVAAQAPSPIYQQASEPTPAAQASDNQASADKAEPSAPVSAPTPRPVVTATQIPPQAPAAIAQPQQVASANNSMAIAHSPSKFMAVPERRPVQAAQPVPIHTAISSNGQHSTMPITGRNASSYSAHAAAVQQDLIDQALAKNTSQQDAPAAAAAPTQAAAPIAPPAAAQVTPVAVSSLPLESSSTSAAAPNGDWFYAAMGQALEKYDRTAKLKTTPTTLEN